VVSSPSVTLPLSSGEFPVSGVTVVAGASVSGLLMIITPQDESAESIIKRMRESATVLWKRVKNLNFIGIKLFFAISLG
jgi:hypothetical protein